MYDQSGSIAKEQLQRGRKGCGVCQIELAFQGVKRLENPIDELMIQKAFMGDLKNQRVNLDDINAGKYLYTR